MIGASGLDWGHETFHSLFWIAKAFAITALIFLIGAAVIVRCTDWGRMFWRITGGYFTGRESWPAWALFAVVLLLAVYSVRMTVLFTYFYNDSFTALQLGVQALVDGAGSPESERAAALFWQSLGVFGVLSVILVVMGVVSYWLQQAFHIHWWTWLNTRFLDDWLDGKAYYRGRFIDETVDNADQRIQQDVYDFVEGSYALCFGGNVGPYSISGNGVIGAGLSLVSFTPILWRISGPLDVFGVTVPRALVFAAFAWVAFATAVAFWIAHPLIKLNFWFQRRTADYRFALVRLRENAENVAFYHGEREERSGLDRRFAAVIANMWARVYRLLRFFGWNLTTKQVGGVFTVLLVGPRVLAGTATLGDLQQATSAFGQVQDALSMPQSSYAAFTYYRATLIRLDGLREADRKARGLPVIATREAAAGLELTDVQVRKPDGTPLITDLNLRLEPGDALVVKGGSGVGKTTLLRSIGQLWPFTEGRVSRPLGDAALFLSQRPYLPLGDLRTAITYPAAPEVVDDETLRATLITVNLGHLTDRLDEETDWASTLSPGEQQRVAFARILLLRPEVVFLDEATSAVDEGLEYTLYHLVRTETPDTVLVSVAHRSTVDRHHTHRLELAGGGAWKLSPIGAVRV
ncbi:ABC transporter ATP-binding protein/permease [Nocardia otitidiscaviarum]|uniref:ABC transporter ATP-binding protein/permease n=1 Tax=Nocardia otitidiscaviarum TaxID=1823 RepID=UPI0018961671|nr:ABC transporter ATP-binding protein/permease [Nocardia otitidiscaviarum]MBF6183566.1 ABC transporter ATP-binding protein/permease [Nocardia otitidiscaviarum]